MSNDDITERELLLATALAGQREIHVQGHSKPLRVHSLRSGCGDIADGDGVSFEFGDEGCWVVPLSELEAIVDAARAARAPGVAQAFKDAMRSEP